MLLEVVALVEQRDVITAGGAIVVALVGVVGSIQVALIQSGRKASQAAARSAGVAAVQTQSNETDHAEVALLLERLWHEQQETRKDIGGIREEQRLTRQDHQLLVKRLDTHLEEK